MRDLLRLAEQLGRRGLIETGLGFPAQDTDGLEQAQRSKPVGIGGVFRRFERHLHMRLRREIVNLVRLRFLHDANDIGGVGHIAVMQVERDALFVRIMNEMVDALGVERRRPAFHAVYDISLRQQQFRQSGRHPGR